MDRILLDCARTRTNRLLSLLAVGAFAACFASAAPASASLILDSLHYDGHVRSGATTGVEKHFNDFSPDVAPPAGTGSLPADNSMLPAPLVDGSDLSLTLTETNDVFNGDPVRHSILTITRPGVFDIFNNALDSNIPLPIDFDGLFYSSMLNPGEKVAVANVQIESIPASGLPPFPAPGSQVITGLGTPADPLRVQLGIAANQVPNRNGAVKVHILYMTMPIPEPTTGALALLGIVGVIGVARRRHS